MSRCDCHERGHAPSVHLDASRSPEDLPAHLWLRVAEIMDPPMVLVESAQGQGPNTDIFQQRIFDKDIVENDFASLATRIADEIADHFILDLEFVHKVVTYMLGQYPPVPGWHKFDSHFNVTDEAGRDVAWGDVSSTPIGPNGLPWGSPFSKPADDIKRAASGIRKAASTPTGRDARWVEGSTMPLTTTTRFTADGDPVVHVDGARVGTASNAYMTYAEASAAWRAHTTGSNSTPNA